MDSQDPTKTIEEMVRAILAKLQVPYKEFPLLGIGSVSEIQSPDPGVVKIGHMTLSIASLERRSIAERMLDTARAFEKQPRDELIIAGERTKPFDVEFTAACLKFAALPLSTRFRAMAEGWGYDRIIREIH